MLRRSYSWSNSASFLSCGVVYVGEWRVQSTSILPAATGVIARHRHPCCLSCTSLLIGQQSRLTGTTYDVRRTTTRRDERFISCRALSTPRCCCWCSLDVVKLTWTVSGLGTTYDDDIPSAAIIRAVSLLWTLKSKSYFKLYAITEQIKTNCKVCLLIENLYKLSEVVGVVVDVRPPHPQTVV